MIARTGRLRFEGSIDLARFAPAGSTASVHAELLGTAMPIADGIETAHHSPLPVLAGFSDGKIRTALVIGGFLLSALGLVAIAVRQSAFSQPAGLGWFRYWFCGSRALYAFMAAWGGLALWFNLPLFATLLTNGSRLSAVAAAGCLILPILAAQTMVGALGRAVAARAHPEWTPSDIRTQFFLLPAMIGSALLLMQVSIFSGGGTEYIALTAVLILSIIPMRAGKLTQEPLREGPLAERIRELASRAGVALKSVWIVSAGRVLMANAFAASPAGAQGPSMSITRLMLETFNRREVDCVLAHELTHVRLGHTQRVPMIGWTMAMSVILCIFLTKTGAPWWIWAAPPAVVLGGLHIRRSYEYQADAGVLQLTNDAEGFISALARLSQVNRLPLDLHPLEELLLGHPSTRKRIERLAAGSAVAPERVEELLRSPLQGERYSQADEPQAFLADHYRSRTGLVYSLLMLLMLGTIPAAVLFAAPNLDALPAFIVATGLAMFSQVAALQWSRGALQELSGPLRAKLNKDLDLPAEALFAGFGPSPERLIYEHHYAWDLGFLFIDGDELRYAGERTAFRIPRDQIEFIRLGKGRPAWIPEPFVYVGWKQGGGCYFVLYFDGFVLRRIFQIRQQTRALEKWLAAPAISAAGDWIRPDFSSVGGHSSQFQARSLVTPAFVLGLTSWSFASILGAEPYVAAGATLTAWVAMLLPNVFERRSM
jgi:Zn-dependent protease with chaperone function